MLAAVRPVEKEHRAEQTQALRGKELRLYKRAADSQYGLRLNGQEKDDAHHGYGTVARGHVQTEGALNIAAERYEIPVLPVDRLRGRTAAVYGTRDGLQSRFGQGLGGIETVKVYATQKCTYPRTLFLTTDCRVSSASEALSRSRQTRSPYSSPVRRSSL